MEKCDLSRLSDRSFERLVRALCFNKFGTSGVVYSPGPDGGRDFACEGKIRGYEGRDWNGYLVVQAKFKESLRGGVEDLSWLQDQLKQELDAYLDPASGRRQPKYYIIATNVPLSGADGKGARGSTRKGGLTKTWETLASWSKKIGLVDFDIWPADKINDLLIDAPEIRRTYAAWVTPGDVLHEVFDWFKAKSPEFGGVIRRSLKNSLKRDQFVRLKDAGAVSDLQIRTSQVFIDLPVSMSAPTSRNEAQPSRDAEKGGAVSLLVERARECLGTEFDVEEQDRLQSELDKPRRNRVVLLGGPGQGKSTLCQFLTQIFRAVILESDRTLSADEQVGGLITEILLRARQEKIPSGIPMRYPVHVLLPRFADAISLAKEERRDPPSILAHIASDIGRTADEEIGRQDLRHWLKRFPWLIIFDGLDEVPPSGERIAVLDAVSDFLTEVADAHADVLLVITTRPQGYNSDLDPKLWEHWRLADLSTERALAYARTLADAQYPGDPDRKQDITRRLKDASSKPATSRLMVSPLQVTIMYMIADTGGGVPSARWTLFNEYYEILKRREKAKGGETQKIIERNLALLGPIHQLAGLVLQTDSEQAGQAGATLDPDRFRRLVRGYLASEGFESSKLEDRIEELTRIALHRLVLLSSREEGRITFDVRSLQEYMAASALTSCEADVMEARLSHIAGKAHWRHVFLIAASRCFSDDGLHHRRSAVVGIPRQLETNQADLLIRNGAKLALEMFTDGIGADHPRFRRQLAMHALDLLNVGPGAQDKKLSMLWEDSTESLLLETLRARLREGHTRAALAAWKLLFRLAERGCDKAIAISEHSWPTEDETTLKVIGDIRLPLPSERISDNVRSYLLRKPPSKILYDCYPLFADLDLDESGKVRDVPRALAEINFPRLIDPWVQGIGILTGARPGASGPGLKTNIVFLKDGATYVDVLEKAVGDSWSISPWAPLLISASFHRTPNKDSLAESLRAIWANKYLNEAQKIAAHMPWPLASLVFAAESESELPILADRAFDGDFGDVGDWRSAELRWMTHGIQEADLIAGDGDLCFDQRIGVVGAPAIWRMSLVRGQSRELKALVKISRAAEKISGLKRLAQLATAVQFSVRILVSGEKCSKEEIRLLLSLVKRSQDLDIRPDLFTVVPEEAWDDEELVQQLTDFASRVTIASYSTRVPSAEPLIKAFRSDESRRGLLVAIAAMLMGGEKSANTMWHRLPNSAFHAKNSDAENVCGAAVLLRLLRGDWDQSELEKLLDSIVQREGEPFRQLLSIRDLIQKGELGRDKNEMLLTLLVPKLMDRMEEWVDFFQLPFSRCLDARRSRLMDRNVWSAELSLPKSVFSILQSS